MLLSGQVSNGVYPAILAGFGLHSCLRSHGHYRTLRPIPPANPAFPLDATRADGRLRYATAWPDGSKSARSD